MFPYAYQLKNKFQLEEESIGEYILCGILHPAAVQDCTKFRSLITDVFLQLLFFCINFGDGNWRQAETQAFCFFYCTNTGSLCVQSGFVSNH